LELFHKAGLLQVMLITVNRKKQKGYSAIWGGFRQSSYAFKHQ